MNLLSNLLHQNNFNVTLLPINVGIPDAVLLQCDVLPSIRVWKSGFFQTFQSFLVFRKYIKRVQPNTIILNCELSELYSILIPFKIPIVAVEHTSKPWKRHALLGIIIRTHLRVRKTTWVLVSSHLNKRFIYGKDYWVIPNLLLNGIESKRRINSRVQKELIFIGRLSIEKDPKMFLEIVKLSKLPARIIGSGVLSESLLSLTKQNSLVIDFMGQLTDPWREICDRDLVVITSRYEGDGLVILEALTRNQPILLRDIPDLRRFGFPEKNYFSSPNDAAEKIRSSASGGWDFVIPENIAREVLSPRNELKVIGKWTKLLQATN